MAYSNDPAVWDIDWNGNGSRDETKAQTSEMVRNAAKGLLANLRRQVGDRELIMGNAGPIPALSLAPYVNGYLFECFNGNWDVSWLPTQSQAGWRNLWDAYRAMQAATRLPRINTLEGCGKVEGNQAANPTHLAPTAKDLQTHRMGLATALLSDGFYEYDLFDARSAPYWFDEYSVNENGAAVEDRAKKGYLGQALAGAVELGAP